MKTVYRKIMPGFAFLIYLLANAVLGRSLLAQTPTISNRVNTNDISYLLKSTGEYDFLVEFDIAVYKKKYAGLRKKRALKFNDAKLRTDFAKELKLHKQSIMKSIQLDKSTFTYDYKNLPLLHVRTRSALLVRALKRLPGVIAIHKNMKLHLFLKQSAPLIQQDKSQTLGVVGQGVSVAVLDTGVDYTRSAFGSCTAPSVPAGCRVVLEKEIAINDGQLDANGHGTNVAGIVAGIATGTSIVAYDVFDGASASLSDITKAIDDVVSIKDTYNIVAINLSLGGSTFQDPCSGPPARNNYFQASIDAARNNGILTVAATGNSGESNAIAIPACTPGVVSVGAVYDSNVGSNSWWLDAQHTSLCTDSTTSADKIACFSNSAYFLTLLAPGAFISAAGITFAGTSQATPHVSGAVAVLRAAYPADTLDETVSRLTSKGLAITDSRNGIIKPRLDLLASVGAFNDQIASAVVLSGQSGTVYVENSDATLEVGEPLIVGVVGGKSVWWTWQAPITGPVSIDTVGSNFDTLLAAYLGNSMPTLMSVAENDNNGAAITSKITFTANAGSIYTITVDGKNASSGTVRVNLQYIDTDGDTVIDALDNCPNDPNPLQENNDGDAQGDICDSDDDNDGLSDVDEAVYGTDPFVMDTDADGLTDGQEVNTYNTIPTNPDSDSDGVTDGDEVNVYGIDPNVSNRGDVGPRGAPDGKINAGDLVVLTRLVLGSIQPTALEQILADINADSMLDAADILLLQRAIVNGTHP